MAVAPAEVPLDDPLTYTLTVSGATNPAEIERPDLSTVAGFADDFRIEKLPNEARLDGERLFAWRLRPKNLKVSAIPSVPFVYFRPGCEPASAGFMTTDTGPPLPLKVLPAKTQVLASRLTAPEELFALASTTPRWQVPIWLTFVGTPLLALGLALLGRRLFPDSCTRLRIRRTRAARRALARLRTAPDVAECRRIILGYLADRHGLPATATTPAEVSAFLGEPVGILDEYDAVRFGPAPSPPLAELRRRGEDFVIAWEAKPCRSS